MKKAPKTSKSRAARGKAPAKPVAPADPTPRIARRERRRERSREEIVDAARRVLVRDGLPGATLDAIAREVGLSKAALYYYYPSKDALFFEVIYGVLRAQSRAVHDAVAASQDGGEALAAIVRETVRTFSARLDDFRLVYLHAQVAGPGVVRVASAQLERLRPLNELAFAGAAKILADGWKHARGRARVEPRLMAFLANIAAVGLLTMKGAVESVGDPLLYSDEQLVEGFARIFEAAAAP